ncbi:MAG: AAA family ATPase [Thermoleophilaceae bacterium]|nr:AAA family ATPase [Thermoleophilaceae bacterium]
MSATTEALVRGHLPPGATTGDLGQQRLRDLAQPERVYQLNHDELPTDFPRLRSLDTFKNNLPLQLTSFVGREAEIEEVKRRLRYDHLVTITGAGGSGKTRLALQVAADVIEDFDDGVWLIDLSALSDRKQIERSVAQAVDVREEPGRELAETLIERLGDKALLLVLDNCEHVLDAVSRSAESLLRAIPELRLLATSREPLNIAGETAWRVPTLSMPDSDRVSDVAGLDRYEAIRLFVDRALTAQPKFGLSPSNAPAVVQICHRLDGVPLAIELAAARMRLMAPDEILKRLEDRFHLLTGGSRTALPRQQTLRAAVDWSHDLLSDSERVLFRRLSVFAGGFDLEAAHEVGQGEAIATADVLDLLSALVDKSLVATDVTEGGAIRYRLHETLRQYGREKLAAAADETEARERHLTYFIDLAERAYEHAGRVDPTMPWLDRLDREHDNFRAALAWARDSHRDKFVQLSGALVSLWWLPALHIKEGREWLTAALTERQGPARDIARAMVAASSVASWQADPAAAHALAAEALHSWQSIGDQIGVALAHEALGWSQVMGGEDLAALTSMEACLAILGAMNNERLYNRGQLNVSQVLVNLGRVEEVESVASEALERGGRLGEERDIWLSLHFLADSALARGDPAAAEGRYRQSLGAALDYGATLQAGMEVQGMAMALCGQGRVDDGLRLNAAAQAWLHAGGLHSENVPFWSGYMHRYIDPARAELSGEALTALEEEGQQMGFEAAIDFALHQAGSQTSA